MTQSMRSRVAAVAQSLFAFNADIELQLGTSSVMVGVSAILEDRLRSEQAGRSSLFAAFEISTQMLQLPDAITVAALLDLLDYFADADCRHEAPLWPIRLPEFGKFPLPNASR